MAFCLPTHAPTGASATVALDRTPGPGVTASQATVTVHPASLVSNPDYVQQLSWQGHTKSIEGILRRIGPGVYRTVKPLPLTGSWKSLIRFQQGRTRADVPVYMPADPAIPAALIPAERTVTRGLVTEHTLMQRERKHDIAGWLWTAATVTVLVIIAVLLAIIGWGLNRVAGLITGEPPAGRRVALRSRRARRPSRDRGGGSMTALACTSHLLVDLPLFGGPVAFVVGAILLIRRSERRRFDEEGGVPERGSPHPAR